MTSWLQRALDVVEEIFDARGMGGKFTTDDIWRGLEIARVAPPENPKQMSVVINLLRKHKLIRSAGVTKTERPERNSGYVTVWVIV